MVGDFGCAVVGYIANSCWGSIDWFGDGEGGAVEAVVADSHADDAVAC